MPIRGEDTAVRLLEVTLHHRALSCVILEVRAIVQLVAGFVCKVEHSCHVFTHFFRGSARVRRCRTIAGRQLGIGHSLGLRLRPRARFIIVVGMFNCG